MKVLMICTVPLASNGIATCVVNCASALSGDAQMHILAPEGVPEYMQTRVKELGICLHQLPNRKNSLKSYFLALLRHLRKERYDVVHVHGNSATMAFELLAAFLSGTKKRIAHCHTSKCEHQKAHKLLWPLFTALHTSALACSTLAGDWIFGSGKFTVLNNALPLGNYAYDPAVRKAYRQDLGLDDDTLVLGHIGHFNESKNQAFLVELMKDLPKEKKVKLLFVGEGDLAPQIQEQVAQLGLQDRIAFLGTRNDIPDLLQAMDLFALPSKWEGLGIVLLEAQLAGLRCLASSEVPTAADLAGAVSFLSLDEPDRWQQAILSFTPSDDRNHLAGLSAKAATEKGFDIAAEANKLLAIYKK